MQPTNGPSQNTAYVDAQPGGLNRRPSNWSIADMPPGPLDPLAGTRRLLCEEVSIFARSM
jgi:hypothetical protein